MQHSSPSPISEESIRLCSLTYVKRLCWPDNPGLRGSDLAGQVCWRAQRVLGDLPVQYRPYQHKQAMRSVLDTDSRSSSTTCRSSSTSTSTSTTLVVVVVVVVVRCAGKRRPIFGVQVCCCILLVLSVYFWGFQFDPYTNLARVTGMARNEAVCEVFFVYFYCFRPTHSVCKSVGPAPPVHPLGFRASSGSGRLGFLLDGTMFSKQARAGKNKAGGWVHSTGFERSHTS